MSLRFPDEISALLGINLWALGDCQGKGKVPSLGGSNHSNPFSFPAVATEQIKCCLKVLQGKTGVAPAIDQTIHLIEKSVETWGDLVPQNKQGQGW